VAWDRVHSHGERLLAHRLRTPFAEIDLLFASGGTGGGREGAGGFRGFQGLSLIEVKSWQGDLWRSDLISRRQVQRLERARLSLEARSGRPVRLLLAVVEMSGRIRYFDDLTGY